ncbi:MAG TPA: glycolate oxidase subunit GlcF [Steroidobacteraceae bacterium]|nr:glycolate oxidase subunit GlcF [Steroidobacteraceae bacterium]
MDTAAAGAVTEAAAIEARGIAASCNHFGFCTSTCPTYALTHEENESPRGRIALIGAMLESGAAPDPRTVAHIDSCLSCLACTSVCAMKVDYMHLIDHARSHVERHYRRPLADRLLRRFVAQTISRPGLLRAALTLARPARAFRRLLPGRLGPMLELLPRRSPGGADIAPGIHPAVAQRRQRVALLAGCAQRTLAPQINTATVSLLTRLGCEVVIPEGAGCCGSLELHMGRGRGARRSALRNIQAWLAAAQSGLDAILINASGCGTTVKDYHHLFEHDPSWAGEARRISSLALDVSEFLARIGLGATVSRPYRVAYHDACSLRNGQRVTRQPRELLRAAGYEVVDVPEGHFCCGSAGTYNLLNPGKARLLGERKGRHVDSSGAEVLAVGNIGCMSQLSNYTRMPIVHTVELLDWATGGARPPSLAGLPPPAGAGLRASPGEGASAAAGGVGIW